MATNNRIPPYSATRRKTQATLQQPEDENVVLARAVFDEVMEQVNEPLLEVQQRLQNLAEQLEVSKQADASLTKELNQIPNKVEHCVKAMLDKVLTQTLQAGEKKTMGLVGEVLVKELPTRVQQMVELGFNKEQERYDKSLESKSSKLLEDALDKEFHLRVGTLVKNYDSRINELEVSRPVLIKDMKSLQEAHQKELVDIQASHEKHIEQMKMLLEKQEKRLEEVESAHEKQFERMKEFILALPIPQVFVPPEAIKVEQSTPQVKFSVPENSIRIEQQPSIVNITNPKQPASIVNLTLPEQKFPDIHVNVPAARKTRKLITYDGIGRPVEIVEGDVNEVSEFDKLMNQNTKSDS